MDGRTAWEPLLAGMPPERRQAMEFLRAHLPESDLDCYGAELFAAFADHALLLRERAPWCRELDWEIFAHYVLFPRVNDEDLSFHRRAFYDELWPRVRDLPTVQARVLEVNRWCHEHASYEAQDERTASPLTVFRCGSGRCGEESAFLVSALRSVGIPARQVYAPRWSHCDDNHAWVEALCGGTWRFLGACEPEPALDRGWFLTAASRAVLISSRIFGRGDSPLHGEYLGREGAAARFNQTARYAETRVRVFRALAGGRPAPGARFHLQILNESSFHTVAVLTAGEQGVARAALGRGSLHVLAVLDGLVAEGDCGEEGIDLHLAPPETGDSPWTDFDFRAPAGSRRAPALLEEAQRAERAAVRRRGDGLRARRAAERFQPGRPEWEDLLRAARGNCGALRAFLDAEDAPLRERLVRTLAEKDLRDVSPEVLEDHLVRLPPRPAGIPEEVYWQSAACPRIALEKLTAWREPLSQWLSGRQVNPVGLWRRLEEEWEDVRSNLYDRLYWTPEKALEAGRCDEKSRRALFVAALRTAGLPARLRALDGAPEYWAEGRFRPVLPERTGRLLLTCPPAQTPVYRQDWSLSRRGEDGWQLLTPERPGWREGVCRMELPAGRFRLVTSVRLPDGGQLAARREFELGAGEEKSLELRLRPCRTEDLLCCQTLPPLPAETPDGRRIGNLFRAEGRYVLAVWLEEGGEPTEHMLRELLERRQALARLPVLLRFLPRGRPAPAGLPERWKEAQLLLDDWAYDLEAVARRLGRDPEAPPLAVLCDSEGRAVYSDSGYRVGAAELLVRVAACLCGGGRGHEPPEPSSGAEAE